jgi:AcrR family transcriptional regulator
MRGNQRASSETPRRGRPRSFDEAAVEEAALRLFWERGFAGTGTRSLSAAMGLGASSLRNAWGTKSELLVRVASRYFAQVQPSLLAHLEAPDGLTALGDFLEALAAWFTQGPGGCLLLNLALEPGRKPRGLTRLIHQYEAALQTALAGALRRVPMPVALAERRASVLLALVVGLSSLARSGGSRAQLDAVVQATMDEARSWATPDERAASGVARRRSGP